MYRPPFLEDKDILALYRVERDRYCVRDEDCISEECDEDSEGSEEGKGGRGLRSSVSLEIYGLQREQPVYFSNREYYRRLEELKSAHLRNMAELERMYISQGEERRGGGEPDEGLGGGRRAEGRESLSSGPVRRLQRINSQEELDFHDTSSGSDQSELCGEDGMGEMGWTTSQERTFQRAVLLGPESMAAEQQLRFQSTASRQGLQGRASHQTAVRIRSSSKVTVPKPFQMMLREEERKRHKVRTRSEIELENTLLKRELEELRECQKKFRASPAPAHIHLPLYQIVSRRVSRRSDRSRGDFNNNIRDAKGSRAVASPRPFHFMEREKRKREAKIEAEFGSFGRKVEQHTFRARPMPSSVYGSRAKSQGVCAAETAVTEGRGEPSTDLETDLQHSDTIPESCLPQRCPWSSRPVKKQIELSIEMVKESDTLEATGCSPQQPDGPSLLLCNQSEDISA